MEIVLKYVFVSINKNTCSYVRRASFYEKVFYFQFNFEVNIWIRKILQKNKFELSSALNPRAYICTKHTAPIHLCVG